MTVIAYKDGILAADKLSSAGGVRGTVTKLFTLGDMALGVCGTMTLALECVAWIRDGAQPDKVPTFQLTEDFQVLMLIKDKKIWLYEQGVCPMLMENKYYSVGSGSSFAMAAMWSGKSAVESVQCAIDLSTGCGGGIDYLQVEAATAKKRKKA